MLELSRGEIAVLEAILRKYKNDYKVDYLTKQDIDNILKEVEKAKQDFNNAILNIKKSVEEL